MNRVYIPAAMTSPPRAPDHGVLQHLHGLTMGTSWSVKLLLPPALAIQTIHAGIQQQLDEVVAQMSHWDPDSDLSCFNRTTAGQWHQTPPGMFAVVDCALRVAQASGGAYDPTIGALVNRWGFGPSTPGQAEPSRSKVPDADEIAALRSRAGWQRIQLDRAQSRIFQPGGIALDLSSIAKGYGVDQVARYLQSMQIASYLVEVGGELRGQGLKADGQPWWVALEQPPSPDTANIQASDTSVTGAAIAALYGLSIATSGDYLRYFEVDGKRYSHTIDPRSGYPIAHGLAAVTVLHSECMMADALATALMVLGTEAGMVLAQRLQLAAVFTEPGAQSGFAERLSPAMQAMLE
ncbi:FAD:protein FMN transferase [Herbaspirillum sp. RTI4]|uniref:FAD:protein FMN transferase n=1 Tax=Herbaspirillum sp. RTI4 TaxID=3048640 RepID=UPI002AB38850|nr:FAD:protein FMN transferase [Herbaspirillum sp. RTI4]MDY7576865.1 FAD:protein FMN transferase [Herbaspirillum sp. RTI4]MEA9982528.1 FAD:protein FMN transferase [Herbaspirillum sp. RTI4]